MHILSILSPVLDDLQALESLLQEVTQVDHPVLAEMLRHILDTRGKRLRPALVLLAGKLNQYRRDRLLPLAAAVELLHTATLVHDDLIDGSRVRRGKPTLNTIANTQVTVLVGDYLFARAADMGAQTESVAVMTIFARTLMTIIEGELQQDLKTEGWRQSKEEYYRKVSSKTASLFSASAEGGAVLSEATPDVVNAMRDYGYHLGVAFQIVDDVLDFVGNERELGKPVGSDLRQRTITLPIIYLLEQLPEKNPIQAVFESDNDAEGDIQRAVALVASSSAIERAMADAGAFVARAKEALRPLPDSESWRTLLSLADYVARRTY